MREAEVGLSHYTLAEVCSHILNFKHNPMLAWYICEIIAIVD